MDVKCERCQTEYEFDDALVSGRGTTVKCTNCGHKFKIRRKEGDFSEDFWTLKTQDQRTLVFTSLRELQRAIQNRLVDRTDMLSRGGAPPKPIGQIPELAPFFDPVKQRQPTADFTSNVATRIDGSMTAAPVNPAKIPSRPPPPPGTTPPPPLAAPPVRERMTTQVEFPPPPNVMTAQPSVPPPLPSLKKTLVGHEGPAPAAPAMRSRMGSVPPPPSTEREKEPETEKVVRADPASPQKSLPPPLPQKKEKGPAWAPSGTLPPPAIAKDAPLPKDAITLDPGEVVEASATAPPAAAYEASSPLPPPTRPALKKMIIDDPDSEAMRPPSPSLPDAPASMGRRRPVGGFIVVTALLCCVGLLAVVWAKDNLHTFLGGSKPAPTTTTDPRVASFLTTGEQALADGNLEQAKESFDKASALAEKDPHVLLDLARLSAVRADVPWMKSRLLPSDAADEHKVVREQLAEAATRARKAADDALAVAPDDASALRAKIDALRISGERDQARQLVSKIQANGGQPESAYVLAALDLAEVEPLWSTVIERLRTAAGAETGPGRARIALAYSLARSGDVAGAKAEIERLEAMPRKHELLPLAKAYVEKAKATKTPDQAIVDAGKADAKAIAVGDLRGAPPESGGGHVGLGGDPRVLVAHAEAARAKGRLDEAAALYQAALDKSPNDTEALSGQAAIAQARGDMAGAKAGYQRVLSANPNYVPALVAVGDIDWAQGNHAAALKTYKNLVDNFPEGTYPPRVKQRLDSGSAPTPTTTAPPAPTESGGAP